MKGIDKEQNGKRGKEWKRDTEKKEIVEGKWQWERIEKGKSDKENRKG